MKTLKKIFALLERIVLYTLIILLILLGLGLIFVALKYILMFFIHLILKVIWNEEKHNIQLFIKNILQIEDKEITGYCVVPAEKVINDIAQLDKLVVLHEEFIKAMNNNDFKLCNDISEHLRGRFGGELDSFYDIILERLKTYI